MGRRIHQPTSTIHASTGHLYSHTFNACLLHGKYPSSWKQARVCIIRKPGKEDYAHVNSYRPIRVLRALSKLFDKILLSRLQQLA
jgi:hypothetical protein